MTYRNNRVLAYPPNFSRGEFTRKGAVAVPAHHEAHLVALAWILQMLRDTVFEGRAVTITNGYRSQAEYTRIMAGGWNPHPESFHNSGLGVDFTVGGLTPTEVQRRLRALRPALAVGCNVGFTHINPAPAYREFGY